MFFHIIKRRVRLQTDYEYTCQQEARHEEPLASAQRVNKLNALVFELREESSCYQTG